MILQTALRVVHTLGVLLKSDGEKAKILIVRLIDSMIAIGKLSLTFGDELVTPTSQILSGKHRSKH